MTPPLVQLDKPDNAITFSDGCASIVLMPFARELTDDEKRSILAAKRQRVVVDSCADAPVPPGLSRPVTLADFPANSLRWAIGRATLIAVGILDCRKDDMRADLSRILRELDEKARNADHPFIVTLISDHPFDVRDYIARHRPGVPFVLATSATRTQEDSKR